jgi:MtN3 and saliva related transmembrane protein
MPPAILELAAALGGVFGTAAWVPQVWKTWRTKSAKDFHWALLLLICASLSCLTVNTGGYGRWILFGGFIIQLSAAVAIIVMKYRYDYKSAATRDLGVRPR